MTGLISIKGCGNVLRSLAALALLATPIDSLALEAQLALEQFHHTVWTQNDGAPGAVRVIVQTSDGFLWMGTDSGLYRFDGVRFDRTLTDRLPYSAINALYPEPDGGLWIGYIFGGATHLLGETLTHYGAHEGLTTSSVKAFCRDRDGVMWIGTSKGLKRLDGGQWQQVDLVKGSGRQPFVTDIEVDPHGTVWVGTNGNTLYSRPRGANAFQPMQGAGALVLFGPRDSIWIQAVDENGTLDLRASKLDTFKPLGVGIGIAGSSKASFDRDGTLWYIDDDGLERIVWENAEGGRHGYTGEGRPIKETFNHSLLTVDLGYPAPVLEDREGGLWVPSTDGVDQLRTNRLVPRSWPHASPISTYSDGSILLEGEGNRLWRSGPNTDRLLGVSGLLATCFYGEGDEHWVGGSQGKLWHLRGATAEAIPVPEEVSQGRVNFQAISRDSLGHLWIAVTRLGLYRQTDQGWEHPGARQGLPEAPPTALLSDGSGGMWLTHPIGVVIHLRPEGSTTYSSREGLSIGSVLSIVRRNGQLWVGGERGVAWFDGHEFHPLNIRDKSQLLSVSGIVATASGELWLNGASGITRIPNTEVFQFIRDTSYAVQYERFDSLDGLVSTAASFRPIPTAVEAADGKIWFTTSGGIQWIDPSHIDRNPIVPSARVLSVLVSGHSMPVSDRPLTLPAGTRTVQIDYTAPSLLIPKRVHFRYELEGIDEGWQDVGARRQAYYTNLGPGAYRFRVMSSNDDGLWSGIAATLAFDIAPLYYQTRWFEGVCLLAAVALVSLLYLFWLRQVAARMESRMRERINERERIARELHDTLLQGIQGLILRFQSLARTLPESEPLRQGMEDALCRADEIVVEGRDRVKGLRTPLTEVDLPKAFARVAAESMPEDTVDFRVIVEGTSRELRAAVCEDVYQIGQEALVNAVRHARAKTVELHITYESHGLWIRVRDDGIGIDASMLQSRERAGHWGIRGMRERTERIRGRLKILSRPATGTEVELHVPAAWAYVTRASRWHGLWYRRSARSS